MSVIAGSHNVRVVATAYRLYPPGWDQANREHGPLADHFSLTVESIRGSWYIRRNGTFFDTAQRLDDEGRLGTAILDAFVTRGWYGAHTPAEFAIPDLDTALSIARALVQQTTNGHGETFAVVLDRLTQEVAA